MQNSDQRLMTISRIVIFLPLLILIISLLKSSQSNSASVSEKQVISISPQSHYISEDQVIKPQTNTIELDLNGPYMCSYADSTIQVDIAVKNKNIFVTYIQDGKTKYMLVNGDCGYNWEQGHNKGITTCGIGQYLSIAEMFSSMGLGNMASMMGQFAPSISIAPETITAITDTCIKNDVEASVFTVPSNITFEEVQKP